MGINQTLGIINSIDADYLLFSRLLSDSNSNKKLINLLPGIQGGDANNVLERISTKIGQLSDLCGIDSYSGLAGSWIVFRQMLIHRSEEAEVTIQHISAARDVKKALDLLRKRCIAQLPVQDQETASKMLFYRQWQEIDKEITEECHPIHVFYMKDRYPVLYHAASRLVIHILEGKYGILLQNQLFEGMLFVQERFFLLILLDVLRCGKSPALLENFQCLSKEGIEALESLTLDPNQVIEYCTQKDDSYTLPNQKQVMLLIAEARVTNGDFNLLISYAKACYNPSLVQLCQLASYPHIDVRSSVNSSQLKLFDLFLSLLKATSDDEAIEIAGQLDLRDEEVHSFFLELIQYMGITQFQRAKALVDIYLGDCKDLLGWVLLAIARKDAQEAIKCFSEFPCRSGLKAIAMGAIMKKEIIDILMKISYDEYLMRQVMNEVMIYQSIDTVVQLLIESTQREEVNRKNYHFLLVYFVAKVAIHHKDEVHKVVSLVSGDLPKKNLLRLVTEWMCLRQEEPLLELLELFEGDEEKKWCQFGLWVHTTHIEKVFSEILSIEESDVYEWALREILENVPAEKLLSQMPILINHLERCVKERFHRLIDMMIDRMAEVDFNNAFLIASLIQKPLSLEAYFKYAVKVVSQIGVKKIDLLVQFFQEYGSFYEGNIANRPAGNLFSLHNVKKAVIESIAKRNFEKSLFLLDLIIDRDLYAKILRSAIEKAEIIDVRLVGLLLPRLKKCAEFYRDSLRIDIAMKIVKTSVVEAIMVIEPIQDPRMYGLVFYQIVEAVDEMSFSEVELCLACVDRCDYFYQDTIYKYLESKVTHMSLKKVDEIDALIKRFEQLDLFVTTPEKHLRPI